MYNDPFFDNYTEQGETCNAIISILLDCETENITIAFNKAFLHKIVKSHLYHIQDLKKFAH